MQIASTLAGPSPALPDSVAAAALVLHDRSGAKSLDQQLGAYQDLASRWRAAPSGDRQALAKALTESPFGQRVQSTLNAFTRAAWAGPHAVPPEPQARLLGAFDGLSAEDQKIVAGLQVDSAGAPAYGSPAEYRQRLQADLDAAQPRKTDSVSLSPEARAHLAGTPPHVPPAEPEISPARAAAMAAYTRLSR